MRSRLRSALDRRMLRWINDLQTREKHRLHAVQLAQIRRLGEAALIEDGVRLTNPQYIEIGAKTLVRSGSRIEAITAYVTTHQTFEPVLKIGERCIIELDVHIGACCSVEIGNDVMIAGGAFISDHLHRYDDVNTPVSQQPLTENGRVLIGDDCFIGEHACILPNVELGRHVVVGANAVVTRSIPDCCVVAGVPARILRHYDADLKSWISGPPPTYRADPTK